MQINIKSQLFRSVAILAFLFLPVLFIPGENAVYLRDAVANMLASGAEVFYVRSMHTDEFHDLMEIHLSKKTQELFVSDLPEDDENKIGFDFKVLHRRQRLPNYISVYLDRNILTRINTKVTELFPGSKLLIFARVRRPPPYLSTAIYRVDLADDKLGYFPIGADTFDNPFRLDLTDLYSDLELITAKRPVWSAVPAGQLKTDFAKAVLALLLEHSAQPDRNISEHSEVVRQTAE